MAVEGLPHLTGGCTVSNISSCLVYACWISCHFVCDVKQFWLPLCRSMDRMKGTGFADFAIIVSHCCWPLPVEPSEGHSLLICIMDMWDELWHLVEAAATVVQHVLEFFSIPGILAIRGHSYEFKGMGSIFSNLANIWSIWRCCLNLVHKCACKIHYLPL